MTSIKMAFGAAMLGLVTLACGGGAAPQGDTAPTSAQPATTTSADSQAGDSTTVGDGAGGSTGTTAGSEATSTSSAESPAPWSEVRCAFSADTGSSICFGLAGDLWLGAVLPPCHPDELAASDYDEAPPWPGTSCSPAPAPTGVEVRCFSHGAAGQCLASFEGGSVPALPDCHFDALLSAAGAAEADAWPELLCADSSVPTTLEVRCLSPQSPQGARCFAHVENMWIPAFPPCHFQAVLERTGAVDVAPWPTGTCAG